MKKIVIKYGIIGGLIVSFLMSITIPFMDMESGGGMGEIIGYSTMVLAFSTLFIAIKQYRDNVLNGNITFLKAFLVGLYVSLITSAFYVISWMIISELFMPDFMEQYISAQESAMMEQGLSESEINAQMEDLKTMAIWYKNPFFKAAITLTEILPVGILVSLVSAFILKKKS
jgi:hypothetical protein